MTNDDDFFQSGVKTSFSPFSLTFHLYQISSPLHHHHKSVCVYKGPLYLSQERLSKSEALFEVVGSRNPNLPIGDVKQHLSDLKIIEVRDYLKKPHGMLKLYVT